jgi:hypothetical protein
MPTNRLYATVMKQLRQLRPDEPQPRLNNLAWMMIGVFLSRSVQLHRIAVKIPWPHAVLLSGVRRLQRFVDNRWVQVRDWYAPVARQARTGEVRLIMDATQVSGRWQWLTVSVAFQHRAIPLAWTWLRGPRGHSSAQVQLALLRYVQGLLPTNPRVLLVADTEFESGEVQHQLQTWHWHYVLRQKPNNLVHRAGGWQACGTLLTHAGQQVWLEQVTLTQKHQTVTNLLAYWQVGQDQPWLLATNLPTPRAVLQAYYRRMWIEEMYGDLKAHGFYLADSHLQSFQRLSRLALIVVLVYLWIVQRGVTVIRHGQRRLVDRNDRRDLSVFQIGLRWLERRLTLQLPIPFSLPMAELSGS